MSAASTTYRWKHGAPRTAALLRGIAQRRFDIVDAPRPALTAFLSRHAPRLSRRIGDLIAARAQRATSETLR